MPSIERGHEKNQWRSNGKAPFSCFVYGCETGRESLWGSFAVSLGETLAVHLRLKGGQAQLEHLAVAHSFPRLWAQWCMCISAVLHVPRKRRARFIAQWNVPHSVKLVFVCFQASRGGKGGNCFPSLLSKRLERNIR